MAVAREVVNRPKLLLANEPTGNLDSKHSEGVIEILIRLNEEGSPVFIGTHSEENAAYSHRVVLLHDGQIQ